jgi:serine/threonine protein kinase
VYILLLFRGLGQGAFGTVFLVEDEDTNKTYALKRVSPLGSRETFANPWKDQPSPVSPCGFPIKTMVNHGEPGYLVLGRMGN